MGCRLPVGRKSGTKSGLLLVALLLLWRARQLPLALTVTHASGAHVHRRHSRRPATTTSATLPHSNANSAELTYTKIVKCQQQHNYTADCRIHSLTRSLTHLPLTHSLTHYPSPTPSSMSLCLCLSALLLQHATAATPPQRAGRVITTNLHVASSAHALSSPKHDIDAPQNSIQSQFSAGAACQPDDLIPQS